MRMKARGVIGAAAVLLALLPGVALAEHPPLDVDCDLLATTLVAVDTFLEVDGEGFPPIDLFMTNPVLFGSLSNLIRSFSGNAINFASAPELMSTVGSCGLMPLLVTQIQD